MIIRVDPTMKDMTTLKFFKNAKKLLEQSGKEDEAFYFEQMVDWLSSGHQLPHGRTNNKGTRHIGGL